MRIILLEDSLELAQLMVDTLEMDGHTVLTGTNGEEGLHLLEQNPNTELLITDVWMPKMNGLELLLHIRQQPRWNTLRCVVMSGSSSDRVTANKYGADAFVSKPFHYPDFYRLIEQVVRR